MNCKILLPFVSAFFLLSFNTNAQHWENVTSTPGYSLASFGKPENVSSSVFALRPAAPETFKPIRSVEHYYKLKRAGQFLTFFGIGCVAGGTALIAVGANDNNNEYYNTSPSEFSPGDNKIVMGVFGIAGGITAIGGGIPMWVIGAHRINKYDRVMGIKPGKRSIGLVYNF